MYEYRRQPIPREPWKILLLIMKLVAVFHMRVFLSAGKGRAYKPGISFPKYATTDPELFRSPKIMYATCNRRIDKSMRYSSTIMCMSLRNKSCLLFNISTGK